MKELTIEQIENEDYVQTRVADLKYRLQIARNALSKAIDIDVDINGLTTISKVLRLLTDPYFKSLASHHADCNGPVVRDGQYACTCGLEG
jgi:hypothetical protein